MCGCMSIPNDMDAEFHHISRKKDTTKQKPPTGSLCPAEGEKAKM